MAPVATGSFQTPKPAPVHFVEAIGFLRNKTRLPTRAWTDLWHDQHSRAFVVAGAMKDGLVADFHDAVTKAIAEGSTLADFRKDFDRIVATHGWRHNGSAGWRSRVIFETNMRTAYAAGRWAQAVRLKRARPFLRYVHNHPLHPRKIHLSWHGTILPVDHIWWETHFTPNGWGCQCTIQSLSEADLKRHGWKVTKKAPSSKLVEHVLNTPDGPRPVKVPRGIDPGFAYNPGQGAFGRGPNLTAIQKHGDFVDLEAPSSARATVGSLDPATTETTTIQMPLSDGALNEGLLRDLFKRAIGGEEAIFTDPVGGRVTITSAVVDHLIANPEPNNIRRAVYWPFMRELIERPQEIWVGFERDTVTGKVRLTRRYVTLLDLGMGKIVALVADEQAGFWQAFTFFSGRRRNNLNNLRKGALVYKAGR